MAEADHMPRITEQHLEGLTKQFGRVKHVTYNGHDLVFRKPTRSECKYHRQVSARSGSEDADEELAQFLIVQVDDHVEPAQVKAAFVALLEDWPFMVHERSIGGAIATLTGVVQEDAAKKLVPPSPLNGSTSTSTPRA